MGSRAGELADCGEIGELVESDDDLHCSCRIEQCIRFYRSTHFERCWKPIQSSDIPECNTLLSEHGNRNCLGTVANESEVLLRCPVFAIRISMRRRTSATRSNGVTAWITWLSRKCLVPIPISRRSCISLGIGTPITLSGSYSRSLTGAWRRISRCQRRKGRRSPAKFLPRLRPAVFKELQAPGADFVGRAVREAANGAARSRTLRSMGSPEMRRRPDSSSSPASRRLCSIR
jgi:hypothetical protein